jgi:hypothetical protein
MPLTQMDNLVLHQDIKQLVTLGHVECVFHLILPPRARFQKRTCQGLIFGGVNLLYHTYPIFIIVNRLIHNKIHRWLVLAARLFESAICFDLLGTILMDHRTL